MKKIISTWLRTLAATVATVYFFTNVALAYTPESNLWSDRRRQVEKNHAGAEDNLLLASLPGAASPMALFQSLPVASKRTSALSDELAKSLPAGFVAKHADLFNALLTTHGTIRKVWLPTRDVGDRVVVHIQDVHQNEDAQRHIGGAIDAMIQSHQADLVALEGAFAPIDVKPFHDFEDREVIGLTADYLLKNNLITGPVHTFMTTKAALPPLVGVDDKIHYDANVEAYRQSAPKMDAYKKENAAQKAKLEQLKKSVYSKDLLSFDAVVGAYKEERASFADYVAALAPAKGVGHAGFLTEALKMEKGLDFNKVEQDRKDMIDVLVKNISKSQTDQLVQESVGYRTGEIRYGEFYRYLQSLCRSVKVDLARFPHMDAYIRYVMVSDQIDGEKLMDELALLEKSRYATLAKTEDEKSLVARSHALHLISRLLNFSLTPIEWAEYQAMKSFPSPADLSSFEAFYKQAQFRNNDLAMNLLSSMKKSNATRAILVTGGYHTEGVSERLRDAGVTVITFTPRIEKIDTDKGSTYLSIFTQEKTPLENLFAGKKLFVTQHPGNETALAMGAVVGTGATIVKSGNPKVAASVFRQLGGSAKSRVTAVLKNRGIAKIRVSMANTLKAVEVTIQRVAGKLFVSQNKLRMSVLLALTFYSGFANSASISDLIFSYFVISLLGDVIFVFIGGLTLMVFAAIGYGWDVGDSFRSLKRRMSIPGRFAKRIQRTIQDTPYGWDVVIDNVGSKGDKRIQDQILTEAAGKVVRGHRHVRVIEKTVMEQKPILLLVGGPLVMTRPEDPDNYEEKNIAYLKNVRDSMAEGGRIHLLLDLGPSFVKGFDKNQEQFRRWLARSGFGGSSAEVGRFKGMVEVKATTEILILKRGDGTTHPSIENLVRSLFLAVVAAFLFGSKPAPAAQEVSPVSTEVRGGFSTRPQVQLNRPLPTKIDDRSQGGITRREKQNQRLDKANPEEDAKQFIKAIKNPARFLKTITTIPGGLTRFDGSQKEIRLVHPAPNFVRNMAFWGYQWKDEGYINALRTAIAKEMERNPELKGHLQVMTILNTLLGGATTGVPFAVDNAKLTVVEATVNNLGALDRLVQTAEAIQAANAVIVEQGGHGIRLALTPSKSVPADIIRHRLRERNVLGPLVDVKDDPANGNKTYTLDEYVAASKKMMEHFETDPASVNLRYLNAPNIQGLTADILNQMKGADDQLEKLLAESLLAWMRIGDRWFSIETFNRSLEAAIVVAQSA